MASQVSDFAYQLHFVVLPSGFTQWFSFTQWLPSMASPNGFTKWLHIVVLTSFTQEVETLYCVITQCSISNLLCRTSIYAHLTGVLLVSSHDTRPKSTCDIGVRPTSHTDGIVHDRPQ